MPAAGADNSAFNSRLKDPARSTTVVPFKDLVSVRILPSAARPVTVMVWVVSPALSLTISMGPVTSSGVKLTKVVSSIAPPTFVVTSSSGMTADP